MAIHDIQCFVATSSLIGNSNKSVSMVGMMDSFFFAGQLFGAEPKIDLTAALKEYGSHLGPDQIKSLLVECGAEMKARGHEMTAAGEELEHEQGLKTP